MCRPAGDAYCAGLGWHAPSACAQRGAPARPDPGPSVAAAPRAQGKPAWAAGASFRFKQGSALAKVESTAAVNALLTKPELNVLRNTLIELGEGGEEAGVRGAFAPDSFQARYRVVEAAAASPECSLTWWPPTDDMLAIIERSYRANLGDKDEQGFSLSASASFKLAPADISSGQPARAAADAASASMPESKDSLPATGRFSRAPSWDLKPPPGSLTMELVSEMYGLLVRHQTEQTQRFDTVIKTREEKRAADEEEQRIREQEAEQARLEKERKEQEELEAALKKGGKGARAKIAQIRGMRASAAESTATESAQAVQTRKTASLYAKAWPGGKLTSINLEEAFQDLPDRPSAAQARYLYEKRARYCDEAKGGDYLSTEGFTKLVRDLGHLQAELAAQKTEKLQRTFKRLDARRKGEISLGEILAQIETEERNLLMPLVDALLKVSDTNRNGLLDIHEFPTFYLGWMELHRIFEVYDDCRIEEKWTDRKQGDGQLQFAEIELVSSVFQGIKSKTSQGHNHVANMGPVVSSLGERECMFVGRRELSGASEGQESVHTGMTRAPLQHVPQFLVLTKDEIVLRSRDAESDRRRNRRSPCRRRGVVRCR